MSSKLKSDTARTNGAKSRGPVTPEGRAKSSLNSRKHGLAAKYALFPDESAEEFQLLFDDYVKQFEPQTAVETELVEVMVIARWRLRRLLAIETNLFEVEMSRRDKQIDREFAALTEDPRLAWVFQKLADNGQSIAMLIRYEGAINRSYEKALKQLLLLQSPSLQSLSQSHRLTPHSQPLEARPLGRAPSQPPPIEPRPWVRSVVSHAPEPRPEPRPKGAVPNPDSAPLQPSEPRTSGSAADIPKPSKAPVQPQKPTSNINPTIPVRDSVS
jgi:hypothetical protein